MCTVGHHIALMKAIVDDARERAVCVCARARVRVRVCVCACVCAGGWVGGWIYAALHGVQGEMELSRLTQVLDDTTEQLKK
jgi:hypothetical protein